MTYGERINIIDAIALKRTNEADLEELKSSYLDHIWDQLAKKTDEELSTLKVFWGI
jgi:hypothetical protein